MKGIKCKNCKNLVNAWCDVKCDSPDPELVRDCIGFEQMTNGDRIRAMSDEELVDFILDKRENGTCFNNKCYHNDPNKGCDDCTLEWLKQPVGVDHDTD